MVARIKQLLDWQQLSPTQFADRIGVGRPVMSHILSERNEPSLKVARSIKAAFPEVSLDWLLDGNGNMLVSPASGFSASASRPTSEAAPTAAVPTTTAAAAPIAAPPAPVVEPVTMPVPPTISAAGQARPAYPPPLPSTPVPARFTPTGRNAAGKATLGNSELAAERFVVRGASQVRSTTDQPLPEAALPPPAVPPASAENVPRAPAATELPSPAAPVELAAAQPAAATEAVSVAQVLASSFSESGKAIRRIVILYSDGSFADYKPES